MTLGKGRLNLLSRWKKMFKFTHGLKGVLVGFGISNRLARLKEAKELSKLLSFETIKAKTFYQIQRELSLIAKEKKSMEENPPENLKEVVENLSQRWIDAMSLLGNANVELQNKAWSKIVEKYSQEVDEDAFNVFLKKRKKDIVWECDLTIMQAGLILANLGLDEGIEALKRIGISGKDEKQLEQRIKGRITNHELRQDENDEEKELPKFFSMLAKVRKQGYLVDGSILLEEWAGILNDIKETNERSNNT